MKFSVLICVHEKERLEYFKLAFCSIWDQQELKPDQIVLVKDGPLTPELDVEIQIWQDRLGDILTLVVLNNNVGLGVALNAGLQVCRYELIARMDTDDASLPERFQKQVVFMLAHPEIAASGAGLEEWDESFCNKIGERVLPSEPEQLRRFATLRSPLSHPVAIFRKSAVLSVGGYPAFRKAQDYALWSLLLVNGYQLSNLPDILLKMRTGDQLFVRRGANYLTFELTLLRFQYRIGFIRLHQFVLSCIAKGVLRLSPVLLKRLAYRFFR